MKTKTLVVLLALFLASCAKETNPVAPNPPFAPTISPEDTASSLFMAHCKICPQCGGPLIDKNGNEVSLCLEGFRLLQEDLRNAPNQ